MTRTKKKGAGKQGITYAFLIGLITIFSTPLRSQTSPLQVVATTTDLAYFAREVGGEDVQVAALLSGSTDPHYARARPDYIVRMNQADLFVVVGLELEIGWVPPLLLNARNPNILPGRPGYLDASTGVEILGRATHPVDRSMGDVHAKGNPHYWTDPLNAVIIARNLRDRLSRLRPEAADRFDDRYRRFFERVRNLTIEQSEAFAPYRGLRIAEYHNDLEYLARRFQFQVVAPIEERPGVAPSARYLETVSEQLRASQVRIVCVTPVQPQRQAESVAREIGGRVVVMPTSIGSEPGIDTYEDTIRTMLERLRGAARP